MPRAIAPRADADDGERENYASIRGVRISGRCRGYRVVRANRPGVAPTAFPGSPGLLANRAGLLVAGERATPRPAACNGQYDNPLSASGICATAEWGHGALQRSQMEDTR